VFGRRLFIPAIIVVMLLDTCFLIEAGPAITITTPAAGARLTVHEVNVTGTASGWAEKWIQTTQKDFLSGYLSNLTATSSGNLLLDGGLYDDFDDNSWDYSKWTRSDESHGITASENDGAYIASGVANGTSGIRCLTISRKSFRDSVSADLLSFDGNGRYYASQIGLWKDEWNFILFGPVYGFNTGALQLVFEANEGDPWHQSVTRAKLGDAGPRSGHFQIKIAPDEFSFFCDGEYAGGHQNYLGSQLYFIINSEANPNGTSINASWDNASGKPVFSGEYISTVHDTGSATPELTVMRWNATLPPGTNLSVAICSSENANMTDSSPWTDVADNQALGLPPIRRYIQYKVSMNNTDGLHSPVFTDISITYDREPVSKVEVSIDDGRTWLPVNGTQHWHTRLYLPENRTSLWSRVTAQNGETTNTFMELDVDTTPPVASISINNGSGYAASPNVTFALNATDFYGVSSMILSERPDFKDSSWQEYRQYLDYSFSPEEGKKTIYAMFRDTSGWESAVVNGSIIVATTPPAGTIVINEGADYATASLVTLTLNASCPAGIEGMRLGNSADLAAGEWVRYGQSYEWNLDPGNGLRTVYAQFQNPAGIESPVVSDSIFLDTFAPLVSISINGGDRYTRTREVTIDINETENDRAAALLLSEDPAFSGSRWTPFTRRPVWNLSAGEGPKTVTAKLRDAAGNEGPAGSSSIMFDATPPSAAITGLPSVVDSFELTLSWCGTDNVSGVKCFDVQYRDEDGPWTDLLEKSTATSRSFYCQDGHRYFFRVRAQDNAGNLQSFPETGAGPVLVRVPKPVISIQRPEANSTVHGSIKVTGAASHQRSGMGILKVQIMVDNGSWQAAQGTGNWQFIWNAGSVKNGHHTIRARAFDGQNYSSEAVVNVTVMNPGEAVFLQNSPWPILAAVLILAVVATGIYVSIKRRRKTS